VTQPDVCNIFKWCATRLGDSFVLRMIVPKSCGPEKSNKSICMRISFPAARNNLLKDLYRVCIESVAGILAGHGDVFPDVVIKI